MFVDFFYLFMRKNVFEEITLMFSTDISLKLFKVSVKSIYEFVRNN